MIQREFTVPEQEPVVVVTPGRPEDAALALTASAYLNSACARPAFVELARLIASGVSPAPSEYEIAYGVLETR